MVKNSFFMKISMLYYSNFPFKYKLVSFDRISCKQLSAYPKFQKTNENIKKYMMEISA